MTKVSEQYAEALFRAAENLGCVVEVSAELQTIRELVEPCGVYFENPRIGTNEKIGYIREFLTGNVSPVTLEFIFLLLKRNHWNQLAGFAVHFQRLCDRFCHRVEVQIYTPFEPEREMKEKLKAGLADKGLIPKDAKEIVLEVIEDKSLIGGFTAVCNGFRIDASLKTRLAEIHRSESQV